MKTAASAAASATAQRPRSSPLIPPPLTVASAGESVVASSAPLKLCRAYVTQGRKNAMSATTAPASATARAMEKLRISRPPGGTVRGQGGVRDDMPGVRARCVEGHADRAQHVGQVAMQRGD